ncbi:MAG: 16S rRNA (cytosine(1402)-N(4))-methyltransferase RsmH [Patescibacteria group bacterium]|jgi:16S rRNA (cytosine1402-N4)-methyltransferase|nr:16S rRNA (cytosine(1402)-N(4))-methyltransferase RsmH [Patescibacteria group bacterium]
MHQNKNKNHIPVLLSEVIKVLDPRINDSYLDLTAGFGGHFEAILSITKNPLESYLIDRDQFAFDYLKQKFKKLGVKIIHNDFLNASKELVDSKIKVDLILADLGVSAYHLNDAKRGFSFNLNGPLDMRMDQRQSLTAYDVVNKYSRDRLIYILKEYGEEPKARVISDLIIKNRPIKNTFDLAQIIRKVWKNSRVDPSTRTFQALRIEVNQELDLLEESLKMWLKLLKPDGRLGVISFHSLEDRIVKNFFKENGSYDYLKQVKILTPKPIVPSRYEIVNNPRSRSAKLRVVVKIKT